MAKLNSKQKGKRGELEVAALIRAHGFSARRGVQYRGGNDSPDVVISDDIPVHVEVKRTEALALYKAMDQATKDAPVGDTPTVWHRANDRQWVVIMPAEDFLGLVKKAFGR